MSNDQEKPKTDKAPAVAPSIPIKVGRPGALEPRRRIAQITGVGGVLFALCTDGALFVLQGTGDWKPVAEVPQPVGAIN